MPINKNEITKEMVTKAMQCKTADELLALAKTGGYELTKEEAEAFLAEMNDVELDETALKKGAGGGICYFEACPEDCPDFSTELRMIHY